MSIVRPVGAAVVGPIAVFAAMVAGASAAHAAAYIDDASVSVNLSAPCPDDSIVITGDNFGPGEQVVIDLLSDPIRLGTVTADGDGDFTLRVRVPDDAEGDHVITARGLGSGITASTDIDIRDCDDDDHGRDHDHDHDNDHDNHGAFGSLPRTGAAVGGLGVAGLALIGGGIAARRYRRRRSEG